MSMNTTATLLSLDVTKFVTDEKIETKIIPTHINSNPAANESITSRNNLADDYLSDRKRPHTNI